MIKTPSDDPLYRRIRKHAERRQLGLADSTLLQYKEFLRLEGEMVERYHRQGDSGVRVARARAIMIDVLLETLFAQALAKAPASTRSAEVAILALGGYGRAEMCPFSDVDIMILYPSRIRSEILKELQKAMSDTVLYTLWDLGLKVGHSSRDPDQAIEAAKEDVETKNALLESRLVTGSKKLWLAFEHSYHSFIRKDDFPAYIEQRMQDQKERHARYGGTVFLQEPDIKNGVGGLRDYQNALWMARLKMDVPDLNFLLTNGYLSKSEHKEYASAYDFLLRVRNELHFQSKRGTDVLDLERQPQVAWYLGYRQRNIFRRVENFMRDYYRHAQDIYRISAYLAHRLALTSRTKVTFKDVLESRRGRKVQTVDGFDLIQGALYASKENVFEEDPERLIRVFRHAQQFEAVIDLELQRLIYNSRHLIDGAMIRSSSANRAFRAILQDVGNVYDALSVMNDCGVLRRFMPEWRGLHCLVQHEYYHRYTADVHTLNTIRELDLIFRSINDPEKELYKRELRETETPALLYLALLLHDIGKSEGIKGHAEKGAEMAVRIVKRMEVNPELSEKIVAIIRLHLEMARFWQHYDIEDPQTAQSFIKVVSDVEILRYLFVLTYCDARGTAYGLWNSYKNMLHRQLFSASLAALGGQKLPEPAERMIPKDVIRSKLPTLSEEELEAHYNLLPERYFIYNNADEIALHLGMVNELLTHISTAESLTSLVPVVNWQNDLNLSLTVVNIVTWDRAGLFYKLAGAFSIAGLSIVSSKAITRADHITIDTFYVCEPSGGVVQSEKARVIVKNHLEKALLHNEDLMPAIIDQAKKHAKPSWAKSTDRLRAPIAPSVDVYHELSLRRTIIEVQCSDRIGLLYRLAKAIYDHGFDINFARIATERGVAVDTFYIEQIDPTRSDDTASLLSLREALDRIVSEEKDPAAEGAIVNRTAT